MNDHRAVLIRLEDQHPFYLDESYYIIGRSDSCNITIDDPTLSREHARIWWENGHWYLEDFHSSNGVEMNGELLTPDMAYMIPQGAEIILAAKYGFEFGWGAEYDNRTISVNKPQSGPSPTSPPEEPPKNDTPAGDDNGDDDVPSGDHVRIWDNQRLRAKGKESFQRSKKPAILIALCYTLAVGLSSFMAGYIFGIFHRSYYTVGQLIPWIVAFVVLGIFVFNPIIVSSCRFFYKCVKNKRRAQDITWAFQNNYGKIITVMLMKDLVLFAWLLIYLVPCVLLWLVFPETNGLLSIVLIPLMIPYFIQRYAYRMVPYILGLKPDTDATMALKLSKNMMNGYKVKAFGLDLSFIGWILLSVCTVGIIGIFYTNPYMRATEAQTFNLLME